MSFQPGNRIKFVEEKQSYKIVVSNDRYVICTKPFNAKKTFIYTIVDLLAGERGPDNLIFGPAYDYDKVEEAGKGLEDLMSEKIELSRRRSCKLNIEWVKRA